MRQVIATALLFVGLTGAAGAADTSDIEARNRVYMAANQGQVMDAAAAATAEAKVAENPNDLETRYKLLGFYKAQMKEDLVEKKRAQLFWMIKNHPEDPVLGTAFADVLLPLEQETYEGARQLWDEQIEAHPKSARTLSNAARFEMRKDRRRVTELLKRACTVDPENPEWLRRLAGVYEYRVLFENRPSDRELAYETWQGVYKLVGEEERLRMLPKLAMTSFNAGAYDQAKEWAAQSLAAVEKLAPKNLHGEAINSAHTVYGQLALLAGDTDAAKRHLLESAKTPGSLKLNNYGPNLKLAQLLAMEGHRETVIEFLNACSEFWVTGRPQIAAWIQVLKEGDTPDFGKNLRL